MAKRCEKRAWEGKIGNHFTVGGIERAVLDDGAGRGTRIAWVNTGSGLRFKIVIDRCMDIADAFFNRHSLAWISHGGVTAGRPDANRGIEWLYTFGGGLLATCGLTHTGDPEEDRGLHGRIGNLEAQIESIIQPDPVNGKMAMSITGVVRQSSVFGPLLELRRTITGQFGEPIIRISDVVTNCGNTEAPHMILYHCNFGWPLVDEGSDIIWQGNWKSLGSKLDDEIFNNKHDFKKCLPPQDSHRGFGEACCAIDVDADGAGMCTVGVDNPRLKLALMLRYKKEQLPWLTNWQHWGYGEYVTALEPGTNPPIGQNKARNDKTLVYLQPGESRNYDLEFTVLTEADTHGKS